MSPEARYDRVLDSFAWVEYFRGTPAGRTVADELTAVSREDRSAEQRAT